VENSGKVGLFFGCQLKEMLEFKGENPDFSRIQARNHLR
jgi:hypothetical protein